MSLLRYGQALIEYIIIFQFSDLLKATKSLQGQLQGNDLISCILKNLTSMNIENFRTIALCGDCSEEPSQSYRRIMEDIRNGETSCEGV